MTLPGVSLRPSAIEDLSEIFAFLSKSSLPRANEFALAARQTMLQLVESPFLGAPRDYGDVDARLRSVRLWPVAGFRAYAIIYRPLVSQNGIDVLCVLHSSRDATVRLRASLEE